MKEALFTSYEELPLFMNAEKLAKLLGVSVSSSYELMHEKDSCNKNRLASGCPQRKIAVLD